MTSFTRSRSVLSFLTLKTIAFENIDELTLFWVEKSSSHWERQGGRKGTEGGTDRGRKQGREDNRSDVAWEYK